MAKSPGVAQILVSVLVLCAALLPLEGGAQNTTHPLSKDAAMKLLDARTVTVAAGAETPVDVVPVDVPGAGTVRENPKDGLKYTWIPPGTFMMGCSPGDNECDNGEKPAHQVTITKGFWMGQTEVTVGAFKRFVKAAKRKMPPAPDFNGRWATDAMPIVNVTWDEAHDFCSWAGGRLPSEAEWEYAGRGGSAEARYGRIDEIAWYRNNSGSQTHEVAGKRPNSFGLFDVLGNVSEWVNDWYDENYYQHSPSQDPSGATSGQGRVLRGGSWVNDPGDVRVSGRDRGVPGARSNGNGVRCAQEADSP